MSDESLDTYQGSGIAIIGMAGRFPGANDLDSYWRNLRDGVESISRLNDAELQAEGVDPGELRNPSYVRAAAVLDGVEQFDAGFFGYSPVEAEITDPQQRLLIECAWEALEHAGYNPDTYAQSIGVYAGSRTNTYVFNIVSDPHLFKSLGVFQISVGNDLASLATRISYKLNLRGPSYAVHTACSTSLVAVHLACQSLLIDECQMALAGGVAVNVPHKVGYLYEQGGVLSPDGHCRPFDAEAGGTIFGSGAGMVLLKRLEDALRDGDTIHAVILGSATNNDGAVKASFTAPSVDGQAAVILDALAEAEVDPETIGYVEAHGTGTALGDPIEIRALTKAFRSETSKRQFCALGSVKSNIGHLDAAAGMSSLLKTALALGHGQIPPSLHFQRPNPRIDFASSPFFVNTALRPWPKGETPRRAGVSSFGFGGTNAHLVLEEAPAQAASGPARPWLLLPLSARSPAALESVTQRLIAHLRANPNANLADLAHTLQVGRRAFDERRALVARDRDEALALLETLDPQRVFSATVNRAKRPVAFMFPGQGAQYAGMARDLYGHEAVFREAVDRCANLLQPLLGLDIRPLIFDEAGTESTKDTKGTNGSGHGTAERRTENGEPSGEAGGLRLEAWEPSGNAKRNTQNAKLTETRFAQPALFAVEYALAQLWQSWGVTPSALIGHSIGEYVAATLAGVFCLEDALALVATRGKLMQALPAGAMLSVQLPEGELLPLLGEGLHLAAANGPRACVAAGPEHAVAALEGKLATRGVQCRRLHTSHAFHSAMMDPVVETFTAEVARVQRQAPQLPFVSNRTGTWITAEQAADPRYWAEHLRHAVRFADGISTLLADPDRVLLEVGPGTTLSTFARQSAPNATALASLRHPNDARPDLAFALQTLGKLWLAGVGVGWEAFSAQERRRRVPLPTYPFERQRFWIAPAAPALPAPRRSAPLSKKSDLQEWFYLPAWHETAPPSTPPDTARRTWLLFADTGGLADALAQRLEHNGQDVLTVRPGALFGQTGPRDFSLDPQRPEDYVRLIQAALDQGLRPASVVHAWGLTAETPPETAADFATTQDHGFYSLVFLTQALGAAHQNDPVQIAVLASQTVGVEASDPVSPAKATLLGACRVIPQEHLSLTCRVIDLAPAGDADGLAQQAEQLLADLRGPADEPLVAYRGGRRLAQRFAPAPAPDPQARPPLRQGGVYLITGGLGGLGLLLGEHLARTVQARLVLVGRTALPPRTEWDAWVQTHGEDDPISWRLLGVRRLEAAGAEVLALDADVADPAQLRGVVAEARARFGAIHGVLHAAGLTRDADYAPVQTTTREMCERHFRSKPLGLLALEQALASEPVELWLLFSSLASVLGGLSYVAYAAANQALDAAAARPHAGGATWISVNWDSWHQESTAGVLGTTLVDLAISPSEGLAAFDQALARRAPQLVVSTSALQPRIDQWVKLEALRGPAGADAAPLAPAALPPRAELERRLVGIWQRVLGVQQIGPNDNFFDLGGDSLSGMQLISELKRELNVQLAPVALFEAPSVSALARMLSPKDAPAGGAPATHRPAGAAGPIAIVGMAGRFPGARDIAAFWRNLCDGRETIRFFGDEELRAAGVDPAALNDPHYIKARPALDDIDTFDAAFFGYTPREAELMDPQHRFFLEVAWEALEQAGYADDSAGLPVGVFGGASLSAYLMNLYSNPDLLAGVDPLQTVIGNAQDSLTTSVSYKLNLKGPSLAVQTFCSTSLVAVHLASQSLQRGECSVALAGGVSILLPQESGYRYQEGSILSPDGHCRPFDAQAAGTLFGNGVGVVVLRRLEDALADGDTIYAVVKGSAINNDGSLKAGYTAPSVDGQAEVITAALAAAQVPPDAIGYVEAHGTGTALGDPIEVAALSKAFRASTDRRQFCALGSVKSNIGHLDRAAGVAALIKAALALRHGLIPPSLHYQTPNPQIDFDSSPFFVNTALRPWPKGETPRRAGVSALGFGGTNAHLVLEEAPEPAEPAPARPWQLLTLSAKTPAALEQTARNLAEHLRAYPDANLADVAYTLQIGRRAFAHRRALVVRDSADALAALHGDAPLGAQGTSEALERPLVLALAELDGATLHRAHALYGHEPVYRERFERCAALLEAHLGLDLRSLLPDGEPEAADLPPGVSIPAGVAVAYALAQQWQVWGMRPSVVLGGGASEYAAACLAGVLDLGDALALAAAHARTSDLEASQAREEYAALLKRIQFQAPQIEYLPALPDADPRDPRVWLRLLDGPAALPRLDALAGRTGLLTLGCGLAGELDMLPPADGTAPGWEGVLLALARLWVAGVPVDWRGYHAPERRRRVPLPTYPFERQRFWVDFNAVEGNRQRPAGPAGWLYSPTWRRDQPPAPQPDAWSTPAHWLVCMDSSGLGTALAERLRQQGQRVTVVQSGAAFARLDEQTLEINPLRAGDYAALLAELAAHQSLPAQVIHCWSLDAQPPEPDAPAWTPAGLSSLLLLAQSLGAQRLRGPVQLWVITERLFDITGEEAAAPGQAAVLGLSQALAAELPSLVCRTLDIARNPRAPQQALDQIMAELAAAPSERLITYRNRHRWLPVVAAVAPERSGTPPVAPAGAACLLAGPLTPAMEQTALVLGRFGWQRLVLALPQPLPARQEWQRWLDTDATDPEAADLARTVLRGALPQGDMREIQTLLDSRSAVATAGQTPAQQAEELEFDADKLCASYVCAYLSRHGIGTGVGQRYRREALLTQLRIMPKYQRLFDFMLSILVDEGIVAQEGDSITVIWPLQSQPAPEQLRDEFNGRYPDAAAGFAALEHCVQHYDDVLTGALDPIAVLYPQGSSELMQAITDNQARFSNLTACREQIAQLAAGLARRQPGKPLRILEIGAGEGNLTWPVAAALHGLPVTMHVSDIGKSFVIGAERRAEALGYDWMSFGVLDIARDPAEQGYRPFDYDLILASEVFHATRDVRASLGHASELLAPGGLLCLVEATRAQRWSTMIWGMLDGWWHFEDTDLRSDSPLLPAEGWREVGQHCGLTPLGPRAGVVDGDYSLLALQQPDAPASPRFAPWRAALLRKRQGHMRRTLAAIQRLEQAGLGLLVLDGDPLTPRAAGQLLAQAEAQAGPLRGVVVALDGAGDEPASLSATSRGAFERAVTGRLSRLLALEPHGRGRTLDLALLLGTLAAFAPSPGAAAEAAAQQTAAALAAQSHAGDGPRWTCLHLDDQASGPALEHALEQALAAPQPQLLVAPRDLERASQDWWRVARPAEGATAPGLPVRHTRPKLPTAYVAPRDEAEQQIEQIWQEVLGMSQLGIHDSFLDLGGDSLQATQLLSRLRDTFGQEIPLRTFFETPTIAGLAQALARLRAEQEQRDMLDVLAMIQQLSPEQLAQELQRRRQASAEPPVGAP